MDDAGLQGLLFGGLGSTRYKGLWIAEQPGHFEPGIDRICALTAVDAHFDLVNAGVRRGRDADAPGPPLETRVRERHFARRGCGSRSGNDLRHFGFAQEDRLGLHPRLQGGPRCRRQSLRQSDDGPGKYRNGDYDLIKGDAAPRAVCPFIDRALGESPLHESLCHQ